MRLSIFIALIFSFVAHADIVSETYVRGSWDRVQAQDLRLLRTASGERLVLTVGLDDRRAGEDDYTHREITLPSEVLKSADLAELATLNGGLRFNPLDGRLRARRAILRRVLDVDMRKIVRGNGLLAITTGVFVVVRTK